MLCSTDISKDQREVVHCEHPAPLLSAACWTLGVGRRKERLEEKQIGRAHV